MAYKYIGEIWSGKPKNFLGLSINFTKYILTDKKLIVKHGLFVKEESIIELYKVTDRSLRQNLYQALVKCGDIRVYAKDTDTQVTVLKHVRDFRKVSDAIDSAVEAMKLKYKVFGRDMYGSTIDLYDAVGNENEIGVGLECGSEDNNISD